MPLRGFSWLVLALPLGCGRTPTPPAPSAVVPATASPAPSAAPRRIVAVTTALEPGGPSEVIEINERASGASLRARRLHPDDEVDSATANLSADDFERLWKVVETEHLTRQEPPKTDPAVMDGAGHMMVLEWPEGGRTHVHALHWSNPREPHPGIDHLFREMAELARARAPSVKLHYFP